MIRPRLLLALSILAGVASPLVAQRGCFHSPEAPTDVLMLVGAAGMFVGSGPVLRLMRKVRRSKTDS